MEYRPCYRLLLLGQRFLREGMGEVFPHLSVGVDISLADNPMYATASKRATVIEDTLDKRLVALPEAIDIFL